MADNVRVCEIHQHEPKIAFMYLMNNFLSNSMCRHFRLKVKTGHFSGMHKDPFLPLYRFFYLRIEEIGYMGVFLGFGNPCLFYPCLLKHMRKVILHINFTE